MILSYAEAASKQSKISDIMNVSHDFNNEVTNNQFSLSHSHIRDQLLQKPCRSNMPFNFANIQTKLEVSQPGDIYEQDADRIAEQVMRIPSSQESYLPINASMDTKVNRKCKSCDGRRRIKKHQNKSKRKY